VITVDQAVAGASNVLVSVLAARVLGVAEFGLFGVVFLVYVMVQCVSRSLICDPLLVHPHDAERRLGDILGTSVLLGTALGVLTVVAGLVATIWRADFGHALMVLGACLPLLTFQDLSRYLGFALQRPGRALSVDTLWLVLVIAAVPVLTALDARTLVWFIVAWAGSGAVAGLLLFRQHRVRIRPGLSWLRFTWSFSWRYLLSYTSTQGAALAGSSAVGGIVGARALGAVQGTVLLVRPFGTFQLAAVAAGVSDIARSTDLAHAQRRARQISVFTTCVAAVNVAIMLVIPDNVGEAFLGATWHAAKPLLIPTGVQILMLGVITGARAGLLGSRLIHRTVVIDVIGTVVLLVATVSGAALGGVKAALWAVAGAQAVMSAVWWLVFVTEMRARTAPPAADDASAEPARLDQAVGEVLG